MNLNLRPKEECMFDEISLGEIMLRLDPGEGRIKTARSFKAWEGGGEYNVARGLRRCFGFKTAVVTAVVREGVFRLYAGLFRCGREHDGRRVYLCYRDGLQGTACDNHP